MSTDPSSRMLRLLSLLQTHRFWPGSELAGRLDVSQRTLRRDIDRLRELGYLVDATRGAAGGYRLQAGTDLPPLLLDDDEAVAIAVGLRTAAGSAIEGIEDTSVRALAKLEQVLPKRLRRQVNALQSYTVPLTFARHHPVDPEALTVIAQACRDHERLQFEYRRRDGEEATRAVEPHRLVSVGQRWYLVAWDTHRQDWRTFRVDRLTAPRTSGARFFPRTLPAPDAATFVRRSLDQQPRTYTAELTVAAPADVVNEQIHWVGGRAEAIDDERCRVCFRGDSLAWLCACVSLLEWEYELHGPPELAARLHEVAGRIGRGAPAA